MPFFSSSSSSCCTRSTPAVYLSRLRGWSTHTRASASRTGRTFATRPCPCRATLVALSGAAPRGSVASAHRSPAEEPRGRSRPPRVHDEPCSRRPCWLLSPVPARRSEFPAGQASPVAILAARSLRSAKWRPSQRLPCRRPLCSTSFEAHGQNARCRRCAVVPSTARHRRQSSNREGTHREGSQERAYARWARSLST